MGRLLGGRDWVYLFSLLLPFAIYNFALKYSQISLQPGEPGFGMILSLMRSDIFFNLGYMLLWVGLFAAAAGGLLRRVVVVLFHVTTIFVVLLTTCAYQYFRETGTTLDYGIIALWMPKFGEILPMITQGVPVFAWVLLAAALLYAALGPWLLTRALGYRQSRTLDSRSAPPEVGLLGPIGIFLLAVGFGALSLLIGSTTTGASLSFARSPFVNVVLTGVQEATAGASEAGTVGPAVVHPAAFASLAETPETEKRNVVLIHLESTRARSVTPYNKGVKTTPFLDELAGDSLVAERAYTTIPHSSKASVSVNCGIQPRLVEPTTEADPGGIPAQCLADLLKEQGYGTVLFQSSTENFENFRGLVDNFGYEDYYPLETMDPEGYERSNYFGYEDDIMLEPSEEWLKERGDEPFVAEYLMGTGHHHYQCRGTSHGSETFSEDDLLDRYLNCLRLQDIFVESLIAQYKELGLYENTIFVLYGDHGEGFGEHGRYQHNDVIYEEGLRVPLMIHAPGLTEGGQRVDGLSNLTDVLPTVLDLLGYELETGQYPGYSLLDPLPEDRTLMFSCFFKDKCLASIKDDEKYIFHYENQPDEIFDLSTDPMERNNLAGDLDADEIDRRREDLLEWRSSVEAYYGADAP